MNQMAIINYFSILLCDFSLIASSRQGNVIISFIWFASYNWGIGPWYWRMWELLAFV